MKQAALIVVFVMAYATTLLGCGEVERCQRRDERGCLDSVPLEDGSCLYDLVPRKGICVRVGSDEDKCSACPTGNLCIPERNECRNLCEAPPILPGSVAPPEPIFCEATRESPGENPMLSFEEVCTRRCRLQCQRQEQFCGVPCKQGFCDRPEVQAECVAACPPNAAAGGVRDLMCLTNSCNEVRFSGCGQVQCPEGVAPPNCANVTCTNTCSFTAPGIVASPGDGVCDDGDPVSADFNFCEWGTDCVDCGPRLGTRKEPSYVGDICAFHGNCQGGTGSPLDAEAWCGDLILDGFPEGAVSRCLSDCSRENDCPEGFQCRELKLVNGGPLVEGGVTAQACFPLMCSPPPPPP